MKKKFVLMLALIAVLSCLFVITVSAEVITYNDAPSRTKIQISTDDIIEFYDGFTCPSAYVFKDVSTIGGGKYNKESFSSYMDFEYVNGKTGKGYTIRFVTATPGEPAGKNQVKPVKVYASSVPQPENSPENSIDGDMNTRYSCQGICWIEYDFGTTVNLDSVSLAFWLATERVGQFDIEVSTDGINFTKVFDGDALKIDGTETHKLFGQSARYVRINMYGYNNIKTNWNSLLEAKFFVE